MPGTLYVVATPIGHLGDLSARAVETLRAADLIAAEDTRHTRILLDRYGVTTPTVSFYDAVERRKTPELIRRLQAGESVALVSDAGTPGIADPGYRLVTAAIESGVRVVPIPGPCAMMAALVASGLPMDRFLFEGFLPRKPGALTTRMARWREDPKTIVVYESPHRLLKTLAAVRATLGEVPVTVARELTKVFEEIRRGSVQDLLDHYTAHPPKGEITIVLWPVPQPLARPHDPEPAL